MRFSVSFRATGDAPGLVQRVREWEAAGIGGVWAADHLGAPDPYVSLAAAAAATTSLRVGTLVINQDFWHPALLARAAGTLAATFPGRTVLGVGAGHAREEYEAMGLRFDAPGRRVDRTAAMLSATRRLLAGETVTVTTPWFTLTDCHLGEATPDEPPAVLVGGNGDRLLTLAANEADLVGFVGFTSVSQARQTNLTHFSWEGLEERMAFVRAQRAGRAFEANILVQRVLVTDDPAGELRDLAERAGLPLEQVVDCPFILAGPVPRLREQVARLGAMGVGDVTVFEDSVAGLLALLG